MAQEGNPLLAVDGNFIPVVNNVPSAFPSHQWTHSQHIHPSPDAQLDEGEKGKVEDFGGQNKVSALRTGRLDCVALDIWWEVVAIIIAAIEQIGVPGTKDPIGTIQTLKALRLVSRMFRGVATKPLFSHVFTTRTGGGFSMLMNLSTSDVSSFIISVNLDRALPSAGAGSAVPANTTPGHEASQLASAITNMKNLQAFNIKLEDIQDNPRAAVHLITQPLLRAVLNHPTIKTFGAACVLNHTKVEVLGLALPSLEKDIVIPRLVVVPNPSLDFGDLVLTARHETHHFFVHTMAFLNNHNITVPFLSLQVFRDELDTLGLIAESLPLKLKGLKVVHLHGCALPTTIINGTFLSDLVRNNKSIEEVSFGQCVTSRAEQRGYAVTELPFAVSIPFEGLVNACGGGGMSLTNAVNRLKKMTEMWGLTRVTVGFKMIPCTSPDHHSQTYSNHGHIFGQSVQPTPTRAVVNRLEFIKKGPLFHPIKISVEFNKLLSLIFPYLEILKLPAQASFSIYQKTDEFYRSFSNFTNLSHLSIPSSLLEERIHDGVHIACQFCRVTLAALSRNGHPHATKISRELAAHGNDPKKYVTRHLLPTLINNGTTISASAPRISSLCVQLAGVLHGRDLRFGVYRKEEGKQRVLLIPNDHQRNLKVVAGSRLREGYLCGSATHDNWSSWKPLLKPQSTKKPRMVVRLKEDSAASMTDYD